MNSTQRNEIKRTTHQVSNQGDVAIKVYNNHISLLSSNTIKNTIVLDLIFSESWICNNISCKNTSSQFHTFNLAYGGSWSLSNYQLKCSPNLISFVHLELFPVYVYYCNGIQWTALDSAECLRINAYQA